MLGAKAGNTELVAVVANPTYTSTAYTRAFTSQENLSQVPNWLFLTGSLSQLADVWHQYGIEVEDLPAGAMAAHNDLAFVISAGRHGAAGAQRRPRPRHARDEVVVRRPDGRLRSPDDEPVMTRAAAVGSRRP